MKKVLIIVGIVMILLLLGAVVLGVLNATVGHGEWTFGWSDYRYDDSGFSIGNGSVPARSIQNIVVDWIDGELNIVSCEDTYISLTESADEPLSEDSQVHWKISDDGLTLTVKYRASSWFFGSGSNKNKNLTLRIPEYMMQTMQLVEVRAVSSNVTLSDIQTKALTVETVSGKLTVLGGMTEKMTANTVSGKILLKDVITPAAEYIFNSVSGDIELILPESVSFTMALESVSGSIKNDFTKDPATGRYGAGERIISLTANTVSGSISVRPQ